MQILSFAQNTDSLVSTRHYKEGGLEIGCLLMKGTSLLEEWAKPQTPVLTNASTYQRGDTILVALFVGTDAKEKNGDADVTYDATIFKPDGSIYGDFKQLDLWVNAPAPVFELVQQPIVIKVENNDPLGIYKISITVHENNLNRQVDFKMSFLVQ
jgi:hypothetical protein